MMLEEQNVISNMADIKYKFLENIQDGLSQDISYTLDDVLGSDILEKEKQDLLDALLFLFFQQVKEVGYSSDNFFVQGNLPNFKHPFINFYFINPPTNSFPTQRNFNFQPLTTSVPTFNPYNFPNFQFQYPMIQPQPYQQPSFIYPNYPPIIKEQRPKALKESKKKSDKKSTKHHKKHHKKSSKGSKSKDSPLQIETFLVKDENSLNGVINYLTEKTGGNVHDNGTIEVKSNSVLESSCHPKNLLKKNNDFKQYAAVRGFQNAWISFDFKKMELKITDYMIRSASSCNMKNWVLEISDDGNKWEIIDKRMNCLDLNQGQFKVKLFKVEKSRFARFCRFRHCGEFDNYLQSNAMQISGVEFYGKLKIYS